VTVTRSRWIRGPLEANRRGGGSAIGCAHDAAFGLCAGPRIEPAFGWLKTITWIRKVKLRDLENVDWLFVSASAAFNLIRLPKLLQRPA
jgi:hypothetical protein